MPVHCQYKFVAGKKKGTTCDRFLRKGENQKFCYQHRKVEPEPILEKPVEEIKPVKKTAVKAKEVQQPVTPKITKSKVQPEKVQPKVEQPEPSTDSEEMIIAEPSEIESVKQAAPKDKQTVTSTQLAKETPKAKVIELSISESSTVSSSDSTSYTDSSECSSYSSSFSE